MRWRQEPVQVRHRDGVPEQFLRAGRLYLVGAVLDCWVETGRWWAGVASRSLVAGEHVGEGLPVGMLDAESRFWRVEAAAGGSGPVGVYDLCMDTAAGCWRLVRVLD